MPLKSEEFLVFSSKLNQFLLLCSFFITGSFEKALQLHPVCESLDVIFNFMSTNKEKLAKNFKCLHYKCFLPFSLIGEICKSGQDAFVPQTHTQWTPQSSAVKAKNPGLPWWRSG